MKADYTRWKQRLAGEKVMTFTEPDECDVGFYRLAIKERKQNAAGQNNGQWKTIGFKRVALFVDENMLICLIDGNLVSEDQRNDAWTSFVRHPITEDAFRAAERGEPWPDFSVPDAAAGEAIARGQFTEMEPLGDSVRTMMPPAFENGNPDVVMEPKSVVYANRTVRTEEDVAQIRAGEAEKIKRRLAALKTEAPKFAKIESDEQSSAGRGLQARFLELRGEAAGHYEQANRPLLEQQKKLREIWFPIRDEADACKTEIGNALGGWEDVKRIAAKRAQEKADREAREHAEATRLAEEANQPPPPPPPLEKPNLPPPSAQIKAPGVRAAKVKLPRIVTEIDVEKAFAQFKAAPEVREVLMSLAQRAVTAGLPVDGATIEEKSKVS